VTIYIAYWTGYGDWDLIGAYGMREGAEHAVEAERRNDPDPAEFDYDVIAVELHV
jgi:hypothetical protein